jgi:hypothetical protein
MKQVSTNGVATKREVIVPTSPSKKPNVEPKPKPAMPAPKPQTPLIPNQLPKPGKQING